ncbi:hypothetical protein L2E82_15282 [Cichorium intybus]|uniref:Uncharacterized protein n=1 Tax=Cichorium intybus TaxID=13427 RepID=A0ACB9F3M9_CICIN|nr:hypothetical protein L2E82_15282 [Cichorium intybus]
MVHRSSPSVNKNCRNIKDKRALPEAREATEVEETSDVRQSSDNREGRGPLVLVQKEDIEAGNGSGRGVAGKPFLDVTL